MKQHIVAMLRVKNEARWLQEVIESILPLTDEILLFDDHSTDATVAIAEAMGCSVFHSEFDPGKLDEARDKNFLLGMVRERNPDYVLSIDGDEILSAGAEGKIRRALNPRHAWWCFPFRTIWNDRQHYRADGVYARMHYQRIFTLKDQPADLRFRSTNCGGNFHCGNFPQGLKGPGGMIPVDILHMGYMDAADRIRKFMWYTAIDKHPLPPQEDGYRHMVIGDLFPADSKFVHGGPLKLFTLAPGRWPVSASSTR